LYLKTGLNWSAKKADDVSMAYDIGAIIGSIAGGVISDIIGYRSPVVVAYLLLSLATMGYYSFASADVLWNAVALGLVGITVGGPYALIIATVSADLGQRSTFTGNSAALGTVTGVIDGTGSIGSAIGQAIVPFLNKELGWHAVFYVFMLFNGIAVVFLVKICYNDCRKILHRWRNRKQTQLIFEGTDNANFSHTT